jgi:hypothetical protein
VNFAETFPPKTIADKSDEIVVASGQIHHPPHKQPSPGLSSMVWIWSQCLACTWRGRAQRPHGILALTKEFRDPGHVPTPVPRPGSRAAGSPPRAGCTFFAATSPAADKNFQSRLLWPDFRACRTGTDEMEAELRQPMSYSVSKEKPHVEVSGVQSVSRVTFIAVALIAISADARAAMKVELVEYRVGTLVVWGHTAEPHETVTLDGIYRARSDQSGAFEFRIHYRPHACTVRLISGTDIFHATVANCSI